MSEQFKHKIVAYHTCEFRGESKNGLLKKLPIISSDNRNHNQWLTQGAYFWTDSITHAKKWKVSRYKTRVISEFEIEFNKYDDIFDLVGNVKHIEFLFEIARVIIGQGIDAYASPMTISVILEHLKSRHMGTSIFPLLQLKQEISQSYLMKNIFFQIKIRFLSFLNLCCVNNCVFLT